MVAAAGGSARRGSYASILMFGVCTLFHPMVFCSLVGFVFVFVAEVNSALDFGWL